MRERIPANGEARNNRIKNWNGIKTFTGNPLPYWESLTAQIDAITADQLREEKKVWRPEETIEASHIFFSQGKINVVGPPQSGKGTILFGLSGMCDLMGVGYIFISGHHQETTGREIVDTIRTAERNNIPVFYDSFDYLFLGSRSTGRDVSMQFQKEKADAIIPKIASSRVPIAITNHDALWSREFLNLDFKAQYDHCLAQFPLYEIPLYLKSDASIMRFLQDHAIPIETVRSIVEINKDSSIGNQLQTMFDPMKTADICSAIRTYPVLKELARERLNELNSIIHQSSSDEAQYVSALSNLILEVKEKCNHLTHLRKAKKAKKH